MPENYFKTNCFDCISVQYPNLTGLLTSQLDVVLSINKTTFVQSTLVTPLTVGGLKTCVRAMFKSIKEYSLILNGFKYYRNVTRGVDF